MIELVIDSRRRDLGGFEVGRVLPFRRHRCRHSSSSTTWVRSRWRGRSALQRRSTHPTLAWSTVTYLFRRPRWPPDIWERPADRPGGGQLDDRRARHQHSERFDAPPRWRRADARIQLGRLPAEIEETDPAFAITERATRPTYSEGAALTGRLIAGRLRRTAKSRPSPMVYAHW